MNRGKNGNKVTPVVEAAQEAAAAPALTATAVVAALKETVLAATKRTGDNEFAREALLKALVKVHQKEAEEEGPAALLAAKAASAFMLASKEATTTDAMSEEEAEEFLRRSMAAETKDGEEHPSMPTLPAIFDPDATAVDPDQEYQSIASIDKLVQSGAIVLLNARWLMKMIMTD